MWVLSVDKVEIFQFDYLYFAPFYITLLQIYNHLFELIV